MAEQEPRVLGDRYEIHQRLARGGMAQVYLARDRSLDRPVAVKENDLVVIVASPTAADVGMKIQVQQVRPTGNLGLTDQVDGVKRDA